MKRTEPSSRPMFLWILFFSLILFAGFAAVCCLGFRDLENALFRIGNAADIAGAADLAQHRFNLYKNRSLMFALPSALILIFFWSLFLWAVLRRVVIKNRPETAAPVQKETVKSPRIQGDRGEKRMAQMDRQKEQRLFAYWLTAFQREGRLVDFFFEELKDYDDAQIGAAVRNIQQSCKKALFGHVKMKAVVDLEEGSGITLEKGFDPQTFQLVGNIKGEPPFKGIVRHRGWKITQWEIPDLSGEAKPDIVAPAEIEIQ